MMAMVKLKSGRHRGAAEEGRAVGRRQGVRQDRPGRRQRRSDPECARSQSAHEPDHQARGRPLRDHVLHTRAVRRCAARRARHGEGVRRERLQVVAHAPGRRCRRHHAHRHCGHGAVDRHPGHRMGEDRQQRHDEPRLQPRAVERHHDARRGRRVLQQALRRGYCVDRDPARRPRGWRRPDPEGCDDVLGAESPEGPVRVRQLSRATSTPTPTRS